MLEGALILVPLLALLLALIDFSFVIFLRTTFQHAAREGVRYAITYQTMPSLSHDASIKSVVQTNAMGFLNGAPGAALIFIRYYRPDTMAELTGVNSNGPGNLVEISVEGYSWNWIAPIWRTSTPLLMTARASDRMEGLPGGQLPPAR